MIYHLTAQLGQLFLYHKEKNEEPFMPLMKKNLIENENKTARIMRAKP